jgi:phosphoglycerate dehydrogenase-like enzyme
MPILCLPTQTLLDDITTLIPDSAYVSDAIVAEEPDSDIAEVQFWVPGFLSGDHAARMIEAMPALQVIQTQSAGVDRFVSVTPDAVSLCDARGVHGSSTSEWALTAILSMLREFPRFERAQQQREWAFSATDELAGKRVMIIGSGDVGQSLARRIAACDAEPIMVARTARDGVHATSELPEIAADADVIVLLVPLTKDTHGLVDADFLAHLRDGALLVNAARGPVLVTDALLAELQSGRLRAAIDVTDPEPLPADHPLWQAPNLLLTPHVGGAVPGLARRVARLVADQLVRFEAGQQLINVVEGEY